MTVESVSNKQPITPMKAFATGVGAAAVTTAGLFAAHKADVFNKASQKLVKEGKVQEVLKKVLKAYDNAGSKIGEKAKPLFAKAKQAAKNISGVFSTATDKVIKTVSTTFDKVESKVNPEKFAKEAVTVNKKAAKNVSGFFATIADKVIKTVSTTFDKLEAKLNPDKFAKGAVAVDEKLAEAFGNLTTKF